MFPRCRRRAHAGGGAQDDDGECHGYFGQARHPERLATPALSRTVSTKHELNPFVTSTLWRDRPPGQNGTPPHRAFCGATRNTPRLALLRAITRLGHCWAVYARPDRHLLG